MHTIPYYVSPQHSPFPSTCAIKSFAMIYEACWDFSSPPCTLGVLCVLTHMCLHTPLCYALVRVAVVLTRKTDCNSVWVCAVQSSLVLVGVSKTYCSQTL